MKEILTKNAGMLGFISTVFFACMMFWHSAQRDYDAPVNYLVLAGLALILFDLLILWSIATTKSIKKRKGKK